MKLKLTQKKIVSELLINTAVAILSIGFVSQVFTRITNYYTVFTSLILYISMSYLSIFVLK